eukprot:224122-Prymnesium_polylepis.1
MQRAHTFVRLSCSQDADPHAVRAAARRVRTAGPHTDRPSLARRRGPRAPGARGHRLPPRAGGQHPVRGALRRSPRAARLPPLPPAADGERHPVAATRAAAGRGVGRA